MSRYDGLIIPRSYNEYINKSDPLTLAQALQQNNVLSGAVAAGDNKAVKSDAVAAALGDYMPTKAFGSPNNATKYIKIENAIESFGGILLAFSYSSMYFISSEGVINLTNADYGLTGVAVSTDKKTIYLRVSGYRRYTITNLSKSPSNIISDATTTAPSGYTFTTDWQQIATKSDLKFYEVSAYNTTPLSELTWEGGYYAQVPLPAGINKIISAEIVGFSRTTNGVKYQLALGSDGKSLYITKVDASYAPSADEKIGYRITYI